MNPQKPLIAALVVCCLLVLQANGEDPPSPKEFGHVSLRVDHQQQELAELKMTIAELCQRIEFLEAQLAQKQPRIKFTAANNFGAPERPKIDGPSPRTPRPIMLDFASSTQPAPEEPGCLFNGIDKAMMIDAIEHRRGRQRYR